MYQLNGKPGSFRDANAIPQYHRRLIQHQYDYPEYEQNQYYYNYDRKNDYQDTLDV